jgi:hypothetical protein
LRPDCVFAPRTLQRSAATQRANDIAPGSSRPSDKVPIITVLRMSG